MDDGDRGGRNAFELYDIPEFSCLEPRVHANVTGNSLCESPPGLLHVNLNGVSKDRCAS